MGDVLSALFLAVVVGVALGVMGRLTAPGLSARLGRTTASSPTRARQASTTSDRVGPLADRRLMETETNDG